MHFLGVAMHHRPGKQPSRGHLLLPSLSSGVALCRHPRCLDSGWWIRTLCHKPFVNFKCFNPNLSWIKSRESGGVLPTIRGGSLPNMFVSSLKTSNSSRRVTERISGWFDTMVKESWKINLELHAQTFACVNINTYIYIQISCHDFWPHMNYEKNNSSIAAYSNNDNLSWRANHDLLQIITGEHSYM